MHPSSPPSRIMSGLFHFSLFPSGFGLQHTEPTRILYDKSLSVSERNKTIAYHGICAGPIHTGFPRRMSTAFPTYNNRLR